MNVNFTYGKFNSFKNHCKKILTSNNTLIIKNFFFDIFKNLLSRYDLIIVKKNIIDFNKNFNLSKLKLSNQNIVKNFKISNLITTAGKRLGSFEDPYYFALKKSLPIKNKKSFTISFVKKNKIYSKITEDC